MAEEVVVAGAGFAGVSTALELESKGYDVKVIDKRLKHQFTPGLIDILRERISRGRLEVDLHEFFKGTGIEFCNEIIDGIDTESKTVSTGEDLHIYDYLVVALGGEPRTFGTDVSGAYVPYSFEEAEDLRDGLDDSNEALIVGSGYVGIEVAGELAEKGVDVTVVDQATRPMPNSIEKSSHVVLDLFDRKDISFRGGATVVEVREDGVELENGGTLESDVVIWSGGVKAPELVQECFGCDENGIDVNPGLSEPGNPKVFAAGDSADDGSLKTAHNAMRQAKVLAENIGKSESQNLSEYEEGTNPLAVSLGSTGIFLYGDKVYKNRFFRRLKDLVRMSYWVTLKRKRFVLRLSKFFS